MFSVCAFINYCPNQQNFSFLYLIIYIYIYIYIYIITYIHIPFKNKIMVNKILLCRMWFGAYIVCSVN